MKTCTKSFMLLASLVGGASAWAPPTSARTTIQSSKLSAQKTFALNSKPFQYNDETSITASEDEIPALFEFPTSPIGETSAEKALAAFTAVAALAFIPLPAEAAGSQIPSALAAYGHYLSLVALTGLIVFERITVAPGISQEVEKKLAIADILVGAWGLGIVVSGYYRVTQYGKGWEFYSHEPIFWLKMIFICIFGAASFFPTTTFIKRNVAIQTGKELPPMSEKLASRLQAVLNAELVMIGSIPLAATLMARGVGYSDSIPYNVIGPVLCVGTLGGLGFKYIKEALTFPEE